MARVPISRDGLNTTTNNNLRGSSTGSSFSRNEMNNNTIAKQVINSPAYQSAYNVLSNESDKSWLQRLEMIPYSVSDASSTILDDFGLSNKFNDKQDANYQYCMEQISALMAEYQSWKNSLPTTQVQQLSDAGINSAITGQGVSGSSIPNVGVGSNPSSLESTNVADFVYNASSFILDSATGLASVVQQFRALGLQSDTQLLDFKKYLRENGISVHSDKQYRSLGHFFRGLRNGDAIVFSDPKGDKIRTDAIVDKLLTNDNYAPLLKRWSQQTYTDTDIPIHTEFSGVFGSELEIQNPSFIGIDAVTDAEYENFVVNTKREYLQNKLSLTQSENTIDLQEKEKISKQLNNELFDLHLQEAKIKIDLINKLRNSSALEDKLLLQKILLGYNSTDQSILSSNATFLQTEKALGAFGTLLHLLD